MRCVDLQVGHSSSICVHRRAFLHFRRNFSGLRTRPKRRVEPWRRRNGYVTLTRMAKKTGFDSWVKKRGAASPTFRAELRAAREHIDSVDGVVRALDSARVALGLSKADLARAVGMMPESTRRLFTMKGANPSMETVMKLADALGLELTFTPKKGSRPKHASRASA